MPYLIDGHNLIPRIRGLSLDLLDDETRLIELLQVFCREKRRTMEVFFDGAPPGESGKSRHGRVTAYYIKQGIPADNAIIDRLRTLGKKARNWTVVTSDREILKEAALLHARTLSSEAFAIQLEEDDESVDLGEGSKKDGQVDGGDLEEWMRLFGGENEQ